MVMKCLECRAKFGNLHTMFFHYKLKHKDKFGECKCGDISLSGICFNKFIQVAYDLRSSFADPNPNFYFYPNSNSNSHSNPNSNSNPNPNPYYNSNSNHNSNSNPNAKSNSNPNPNLNSNSNSNSNSSSISKPRPIEIKIDLTCNKCNIIKQITCFDKKRDHYVKKVIQEKSSVNIVLLSLALAGKGII